MCDPLDWQLGSQDGTKLIQPLRRQYPLSPITFATAHSTPAIAATSIKLGAFDFLTKTLDEGRLLIATAKAIEQHRLLARLHCYEEVSPCIVVDRLSGSSGNYFRNDFPGRRGNSW
ncbi:MAG: response regulator [Pirellulales bacterium]